MLIQTTDHIEAETKDESGWVVSEGVFVRDWLCIVKYNWYSVCFSLNCYGFEVG
jgi:hypothetical protein